MKTILFNLRLFCVLTFCNDENLRSTDKITELLAIGSRSFWTQLLMLAGQSLGSESGLKEVTHQSIELGKLLESLVSFLALAANACPTWN